MQTSAKEATICNIAAISFHGKLFISHVGLLDVFRHDSTRKRLEPFPGLGGHLYAHHDYHHNHHHHHDQHLHEVLVVYVLRQRLATYRR